MPPFPIQDFRFPLNVYAYLLQQETGAVDYLHYGLFGAPDEPVTAAQQRSTDLVTERLPPAPADILEVGIGTGTTLLALVEGGYRVTGIGPEPEQVGLARARTGERAELECIGFEDFSAPPAAFDLVLLQESFQYVDGRDLFTRARPMLRPQGRLLVLDEFLHQPPTRREIRLPDLQESRRLAADCGFELLEEKDLSGAAAPTVDYLLDRIAAHRQGLLAALPVDDTMIGRLETALREYRRAYAEGWVRYVLLLLAPI